MIRRPLLVSLGHDEAGPNAVYADALRGLLLGNRSREGIQSRFGSGEIDV